MSDGECAEFREKRETKIRNGNEKRGNKKKKQMSK
jgi:hypothetical protein